MTTSLLTTKLYVPRVRHSLVLRRRLIERLNEGLDRRLTLISAPAGYGKTTLVSEWVQAIGGVSPPIAIAWLSLDEDDNDPVRFLTYLVAALQMVDPNIGQTAQGMLQTPQPHPPESLLTTLINDMAAVSSPLILTLDDYHLIQTMSIHQPLAYLLEYLPPLVLLVIVTREDPPLPLSRWRARGEMLEIRQDDLRYTEEETADFLQRVMRLELTSGDITALHQRTEGWPAGLQLAALSLRGREDGHQLVQSVTGSHRYILDYLIDEVFRLQPADVQDFLLATSILDHFCAPLCDAVRSGESGDAERGDSDEILLALEQANLFVVPLDESRQWYRYHRLFRDLLRSQQKAPHLAPLHQRAARWYEENGFLEDALGHLLAAEDWEEAGRVIRPAAAEAIRNGRFTTLHNWLGAFPDEQVRQNSGLATLKGWSMLPMGQFQAAGTYAELARELLATDASPLDRAMLTCLRMYVAQAGLDLARVIELSRQALQLLEEGDPYFLRGAVLGNLAQAQTLMGDIPAATHTLGEMVRLSRQVGHHLSALGALGNLASFLNLQGRRREAVVLCRQALTEAVDSRGRPLPAAGQVHIVLGSILYDSNELALAHQHLIQGLKLGEQLGPATGGVLTGWIALAHLQQAMGDEEAALATMGETRQIVSRFSLPQADAFVTGAEADIQLKQGNVAAAERWAEAVGFAPTDQPDHLRESAYLTFARLLLAQDRPAEAGTLLANCERFARDGGRHRSLITVRILQAVREATMGREEEALGCLEEAVRLAAPEEYRRAFLEDGAPIAGLLPRVRQAAPDLVDELLAYAGIDGRPPDRVRAQPLHEPLSARELQVLELVVAGLSNREIAERLVISVGTVKTHVHHIYGKLAVSDRPKAIARTRELGLI